VIALLAFGAGVNTHLRVQRELAAKEAKREEEVAAAAEESAGMNGHSEIEGIADGNGVELKVSVGQGEAGGCMDGVTVHSCSRGEEGEQAGSPPVALEGPVEGETKQEEEEKGAAEAAAGEKREEEEDPMADLPWMLMFGLGIFASFLSSITGTVTPIPTLLQRTVNPNPNLTVAHC